MLMTGIVDRKKGIILQKLKRLQNNSTGGDDVLVFLNKIQQTVLRMICLSAESHLCYRSAPPVRKGTKLSEIKGQVEKKLKAELELAVEENGQV